MGQSFTSIGGTLSTVVFYMDRQDPITGSVYATIYAHSGTFGTNSVPTGSALATSNAVSASSLNIQPNPAQVTFTFSGINQIVLSAGVNYVVVVGFEDDTQAVRGFVDNTSPTDPGNSSTFNGSSWSSSSSDMSFYVTTTAGVAPTLLQPQYLLANKTFSSGTSLQDYDTYYDPAEWDDGTGGTTTFYQEASSISGGTSDVKLQDTSGPTDITGSTITDISNRSRSSSLTMPGSTATLDTIATTNNGDIYSSRIIVDWVYATAVATVSRAKQSIIWDE
jgi:hypothetical protein